MQNHQSAVASDVYFTSMRVRSGETLLTKLEKLVKRAGIESIDFDKKFTAIKMHFGESGNLAYLRPNYAKVLVDLISLQGGRPFLTDSNTLYAGRRKNALEHLDLAYEHGFSPFATNCHIIIGDGLTGQDEVLVPVLGGTYIKEAKIGRAIIDADILISLTHFKGHFETGFGGAIKNIGMGCASRAGKMEMHSASEPKVTLSKCTGCKKCAKFCASDAIVYRDKKAYIDPDKCIGCGLCIGACATDAIYCSFDEDSSILDAKMAEYTLAILKDKPSFHVNMVIDVSPKCDCWGSNDTPIVPDIGMLASFDPVALDIACADLVNAQSPVADSLLGEQLFASHQDCGTKDHNHIHGGFVANSNHDGYPDFFTALAPSTNWRAQIDHAVKIGLGSDKYTLIEV